MRTRLVTLLSVVALFVSTSSLAAAGDTIATATPLEPGSASTSRSLVGNSGGAFEYFSFAYAGDGRPVTITMRAQPGRGTAGVATGFKLYGPTGLVGEGIGDDHSLSDSVYVLALASTTPGTYFIQVFNHIHGLPLSFQLDVSGLSLAQADAVDSPDTATGGTPSAAVPTQGTSLLTGGILAPGQSGSFVYYSLRYPGGGEQMTITLGYSPVTSNSEEAVGFNLYRTDPTDAGASILVGQSAQSGRDATSATETLTYQADAAEEFLLQVFSYLPDTPINYTVLASGLAGNVVDAPDVRSPERAAQLTATTSGMRSSLVGDRAGSFNYFLVTHPGDGRELRVTVTAPGAGLNAGELGFNVFRGSDRVAIATAALDGSGRRVATLILRESESKTFGIQVFNHSAGVTVPFTISVAGL